MRRGAGVALVAFAVLLAGCKGRSGSSDAAAASTPPAAVLEPPAPAKPAAPLSFNQTTPDAAVSLKLARDISRWPALHREVYARALADLRKFAGQATADRSSASNGDYQPPKDARDLDWTLAAATSRLVSLQQTWFEDTGGAHPNHGYETYLWDVGGNRSVGDAVLFTTGADEKAIQKALCDGIDKAKSAKGVEWDPESFPCPKWRESHFVLAPSTVPGKIGGLVFLFDPYAVGAYAEGEYEVSLPQAVFRPVLAPTYAAEFAGEPKPAAKR